MDATWPAAILRRLLAEVPFLVTGFAVAGLRLAILAILGRKAFGVNLGVPVMALVLVCALPRPRIRAWEISSLRRAAGALRALGRSAAPR